MKYDTQLICMNKDCGTITVGHGYRMDGLSCPRCDGPVTPQPFKKHAERVSKRALFVRRKIIEYNKEHCFDLTPEQVDTVLKIGDEFTVNALREIYNEKP